MEELIMNKPITLHKALIVTLVDDEVVILRGDTPLRRLFTEMNLPFPNSPKPVLSSQFREHIFKAGLSITMVDGDDMGSVRFIPPSRMKSVDFYIGKDPVPEGKKEFNKFFKNLDFNNIFE
jgi:hypothetical protein